MRLPPPDPDGRAQIWLDFNAQGIRDVHLGLAGTRQSIESQGLRLAEDMPVVLFDEDGPNEWMLVDATVTRFDAAHNRWTALVDWSTFRRARTADA